MGPAAEAFLRWAAEAGQRAWQVLPLGPTGFGNSPYGALSSFAGNPLLISPEGLAADGLLPAAELVELPRSPSAQVDFPTVQLWREALLRAAAACFATAAPADLRQAREAFFDDPAHRSWLDDWCLFAALKHHFGGRSWGDWPGELRRREPAALAAAREHLGEEVRYHRHVQFLFALQWGRLRRLADELGIEVLGDLPIYVALDSADVWARPDLFELDPEGRPLAVSGVPPDAFSDTGQLWGTPLYRWERHAEEGFAWWTDRVSASLRLADRVRMDHFRGFEAYWRVPAGEETAVGGAWVPGPGAALFAALRRAHPSLPLFAEDLGVITPEVEALLAEVGLPRMKVLQFAFGALDSEHLPHHHEPAMVVYTGTHDNDTARGWFLAAGPDERAQALDYLGLASGYQVEWALIRTAYASVADLAVVPLQDVLGLGPEARMNTPGKDGGNWLWRARESDIRAGLPDRLRRLALLTGRLEPPVGPAAAAAEMEVAEETPP